MIDNNFIDTIIQLPPNIFFQTPIATAIMVLKKNKNDNNILFIDASNEFVKNSDKMKNGNNSNKLSEDNINNIYNVFKNRKTDSLKSYLATYEEVKNNEYNISVNTYLKKEIEEDTIDIKELNEDLAQILPKQQELRKELDEIIKDLEEDFYE